MTVLKDNVLALLVGAKGSSLSGETMSSSLGVSRAAVWKAVEALRQEGYQIRSPPRLCPGEESRQAFCRRHLCLSGWAAGRPGDRLSGYC